MRETIQEIADVLAELSVVSEAKAAPGFDRPQIAQVKSAGGAPRGERESAYDRHLNLLKEWLENAKTEAAGKRSPKRFEGAHDAWVTHVLSEHEGIHYTQVAAIERVSFTHIRRIRERHGMTATWGHKRHVEAVAA